jgi:hypothetical protein
VSKSIIEALCGIISARNADLATQTLLGRSSEELTRRIAAGEFAMEV